MAHIARNVEFLGEKVAEFAVTRKLLTISLCIMLTLFGGYGAKNLTFSGDYQIFLVKKILNYKDF